MKILLLDDDELSVEMLELLLEMNGFNVVTCTSPKAAIELIKADAFDLIITDFMMPAMNGISFIDAIRDDIKNCRIAFTTAFMSNLFESADKHNKVDRIFIKPIDVEELVEYVKDVSNSMSPAI